MCVKANNVLEKTDINYLQDEVRNGFLISTPVKQAWSAAIEVLSAIDLICKKYDIKYFACWGSLLGAVRHAGIVPWDDDVDICMRRCELNKFMQHVDELPSEYAIHNFRTKENHWLFLTRIVNKNQICFEIDHLEHYHNYPYIGGIDIFVLDNLYMDDHKERKRDDDIMRLLAVADGITNKTLKENAIQREVRQIIERYNNDNVRVGFQEYCKEANIINRRALAIELYSLAELRMQEVPDDKCELVDFIFPWVLKGSTGYPKVWFEKEVRLPFEQITIPVPHMYAKVVHCLYGDYLKVNKVWDGHDYPYFLGQKKALEEVAGGPLPDYRFHKESFRSYFSTEKRSEIQDIQSQSLRTTVGECIQEFESKYKYIEQCNSADCIDSIQTRLSDYQQLVIDLGTLIESAFGQNMSIIPYLEKTCESIFVYASSSEGAFEANRNNLLYDTKKMMEALRDSFIRKKEILFVCTGHNRWDAYKNLYMQYLKQDDCRVNVIYTPFYKKNPLGELSDAEQEKDIEIPVTMNWENYDLGLHCPDTIYIQDPYDNENPCYSIHPDFYVSNLQKYCNHLVYVHPFLQADFTEADGPDIYNLKQFVCKPAAISADQIIVPTENLRGHYITELTKFCGDETRQHWEKTIVHKETIDTVHSPIREIGQRELLLCIGLNRVTENAKAGLSRLHHILNELEDRHDLKSFQLCFYPQGEDAWMYILNKLPDVDLSKEWKSLLLDFKQNDRVVTLSENRIVRLQELEKFDEYLGDPSPYILEMSELNRPTTLAEQEAI